ncbi:uncharacterized protein LAJ45_04320 [Morchella importuna]|uniref:uncharacterized protein n=1 Tax=Morchella importuna TaxID=1174673 RepID=UPI001E8E1151|nr:uncharacterized protein LAJ45_04320 [Morchella importuna]KAH8151698.1 hypothetical protein LAJ45_04320 [Morchella importuna]
MFLFSFFLREERGRGGTRFSYDVVIELLGGRELDVIDDDAVDAVVVLLTCRFEYTLYSTLVRVPRHLSEKGGRGESGEI